MTQILDDGNNIMKKNVKGKWGKFGRFLSFRWGCASLLVIFLLFFLTYQTFRSKTLADLDPDDYADNEKLAEFVSDIRLESSRISSIKYKELDKGRAFDDERFLEILLLCLKEKDPFSVRLLRSIRYFFEFNWKNVFSSFLDLKYLFSDLKYVYTKDEKRWVREEALDILAYLGERATPAIPELKSILEDDIDSSFRASVLAAFGDIGDTSLFEIIFEEFKFKRLEYETIACALAKTAKTKKQKDVLFSNLNNKNERIRLGCISAFEYMEIDDEEILRLHNKLLKMLQNDFSPFVRKKCVESIPYVTYKEGTYKYFVEGLINDPAVMVRTECAEQIVIVVQKKDLPELSITLVSILKDKNEPSQIRIQVAELIGQLHLNSKEASRVLQEIATDSTEDEWLIRTCKTVLALFGKPDLN